MVDGAWSWDGEGCMGKVMNQELLKSSVFSLEVQCRVWSGRVQPLLGLSAVFLCMGITSSVVKEELDSDTGSQNPSLVVFGFFLLNHILHCICFKILFTGSKYLASNWSYACLIRTIKKVKNLNKKLMTFCFIIILCNFHLIILNLFWAITDFILYQIKQTALKSDYTFSTYNKFINWIQAELKNFKLENPTLLFGLLAQYVGSDGFWALASQLFAYWKSIGLRILMLTRYRIHLNLIKLCITASSILAVQTRRPDFPSGSKLRSPWYKLGSWGQ